MYWTKLKNALLYGQPPLTNELLKPQTVKTAVWEISRLISFGWIEELTEDVAQRIQTACHQSQCPEIWDEFRYENRPILTKRKRKRARRATKKAKSPGKVKK